MTVLLDSTKFVDTGLFPSTSVYQGVDLMPVVAPPIKAAILRGQRLGTLRKNASFGGVFTQPVNSLAELFQMAREDPYKLVWGTVGWGHERHRYMANGFRKLIPACLQGTDSLILKMCNFCFRDIVDSVDSEGRFPMGSFPHGGAVVMRVGNVYAAGAVSALDEHEDDTYAAMLVRSVIAEIYKLTPEDGDPVEILDLAA